MFCILDCQSLDVVGIAVMFGSKALAAIELIDVKMSTYCKVNIRQKVFKVLRVGIYCKSSVLFTRQFGVSTH